MIRKIYTAAFCFLLILSFGFLLSGCHSAKEEEPEDVKTVTLYYLNSEGDGLTPIERGLHETDSPEDEVKEIIRLLSESDDEDTNKYQSPIYDGVIIRKVSVEGHSVNIDFESSYRQLDSTKEILLKAAIVKSLVQVEGIDEVTFTAGGDSLLGKNDIAIGRMSEDSFLTGKEELYSYQEKATLYYADEDGDELVPVQRVVKVHNNMPVETGLLNELAHGKPPKGCRNPLPSGLKINKTLVYNNICYVDLGSQILEPQPDVEDRIKVYAMVNTLVDRDYASQVRFTIDGKAVAELNDFEGFDQPLTRDYSLVKETEESEPEDTEKNSNNKEKESRDKDKDSDNKEQVSQGKDKDSKDKDPEDEDED